MRKYWVLFLQNISEYTAYRLKFFISLSSYFVVPLSMMAIFSSLPQSQFAGITKQQIFSWYLSSTIIYLFLGSKVDEFVKLSIQLGDLGKILVKPLNFWIAGFLEDFSHRAIKGIFVLPILFFAWQNFDMKFIFSLIISYALAYFLSFNVGLLTFWVEEVWGIQNLKNTMVYLLGGLVLPYQFFPQEFLKILYFTPFPYLAAWPLRIGYSGHILQEFILAILWCSIFFCLAYYLWKRGLKTYAGFGTI